MPSESLVLQPELVHLLCLLQLPCWLLVRTKSYWPSQDYWLRSVVIKLGLFVLALIYLPFSNNRLNFILIWKNSVVSAGRRNAGNTKNSKELWFYIIFLLFSHVTIEKFTATRWVTFWQRIRQMVTFLYNFPCNLLAKFPLIKKIY